jgi:hypothetical protein
MASGIRPAGMLEPAPGGLFSVASVDESAGMPEWSNGKFSWDTQGCPAQIILTDFCTSAARGIISDTDVPDNSTWPFGIITNYQCNTVGLSVEERRKIALKQNELASQKAVERELWSGILSLASGRDDVRYLLDGSASVVSTGAKKVKVAIALLEQALADCGLGTAGVIHLTRYAAQIAAAENALEVTDDGLYTKLGTPVVAGVGYTHDAFTSGSAPTAPTLPATPTDPGDWTATTAVGASSWGFATGPVYVLLGGSQLLDEYLDHENNILNVQAERPAAVFWDSCCTATVEIDSTP